MERSKIIRTCCPQMKGENQRRGSKTGHKNAGVGGDRSHNADNLRRHHVSHCNQRQYWRMDRAEAARQDAITCHFLGSMNYSWSGARQRDGTGTERERERFGDDGKKGTKMGNFQTSYPDICQRYFGILKCSGNVARRSGNFSKQVFSCSEHFSKQTMFIAMFEEDVC